MFDSCRCKKNTNENVFNSELQEPKRKAALNAYNVYETKLNKPKPLTDFEEKVIEKANKWIINKKHNKESMSMIGSAIKSIKGGNKPLAKRLDSLLTAMGNPDSLLIPVTSEEIIQMINKELGNIATVNTMKNGEAYIFASFNY